MSRGNLNVYRLSQPIIYSIDNLCFEGNLIRSMCILDAKTLYS
jgi:hypothetical protein